MLSKGFIYMCIPIDFYILVTYWKQGKQIMRLTECLLTLTETQDTVTRPPWKDLPKLWIQELRQNRLRNAIMCCEFVCRDSTDDSYWISAKFYGIVSLHKYIALKNYVKLQLFVTVVIKWKNGVMYSPVTYISGFRFNSYTKYFYLSTISTPRSEKSNREGMYWIRMRHGYCLDTQTRIKAHQNAI